VLKNTPDADRNVGDLSTPSLPQTPSLGPLEAENFEFIISELGATLLKHERIPGQIQTRVQPI